MVTGGSRKIGRRQVFLIIGVVVVVILGILAIPYYQNYVQPFNQTIIDVDGNEVSARYFLERTSFAESEPFTMLEALTNELIIEIMAPQYGIEVIEDDIDETIMYLASLEIGDVSDAEFEEWYRQLLNEYQISDDDYRDLLRISLRAGFLQEYLAEQVPYETEQVHLHIIIVADYDTGAAAKERLDAGEDFASVAQDVSVDTVSKDEGGDLGWMPPDISLFADHIESLEVNEASVVLPYSSTSYSTSSGSSETTVEFYYILMVSERDSSRTLTDEHRAILQEMALDLWLAEEIPKHDVSYNFDSETYVWLSQQLAED